MKKKQIISQNSFTEFLLYTTPNGRVKVEIFLRGENIWLTQEKIALLFGVQRPAITKHLKNIFESGELDEKVASSILEHTTQHGAIKGKIQTQAVKFYNLDAILSVGYRVNSSQATQFRIWATERLKEYIIKGFVMDDERLKNPETVFGRDYFEAQIARIRDMLLILTKSPCKLWQRQKTSRSSKRKNKKYIHMTKYILNSGGVRNSADKGRKFFEEVFRGLGKNPRLLICNFAH